MKNNIMRKLPSIDELLKSPELKKLMDEHGRDVVVSTARTMVDGIRDRLLNDNGTIDDGSLSVEQLSQQIMDRVHSKLTPSLRSAINATGIILHTGLGRAMLSQAAVDALGDVARGYCTLATDLDTGQRGSRDVHVSNLICELTGAEAATIVNNNAAATMIILNTLASGKEVIVSRGQLVEIGGSFRMPEVMQMSGAVLREIGTTNKTHLKDYTAAINENTGAILRVHQSNYRIIGFAEEPSIEQLAPIAKEHGLPLIDDLGSGALVDLSEYGLEPEPMVQNSIKAGVDAACFSGDKLIGGPQCGVIVGKAETIAKIKKNPLARALRVSKLEVAAMEATLKLFLDPEKLNKRHPTYHMLSLSLDELDKRARTLAKNLKVNAEVSVVDGESQIGSGSVPAEALPTRLIAVKPSGMSADSLARKLRYFTPPIFPRIHQDTVLFDLRTIQPNEDEAVKNALNTLLDVITRSKTHD